MNIKEQVKTESPIKRALRALDDLQAKLDAVEYAKREPIAIVGMSCRFPGGANSPEAFWQLLRDGVDTISEVPPERWDTDKYYNPDSNIPGTISTRQGGFLEGVDGFDSEFFNISAREAASMDPQQRLLLEVGWSALENAAQVPQVSDRSTGVFVGIYMHDYSRVMSEAADSTNIDAFCAMGNSLSVAAGRLSYILGLNGPSMAIDTSCSSSLVSVHLACQSLRNRECDAALAGGVCLNLAPDTSIALSRTQMLNPEGRCKTFDASANGFAKGEGCGMVVLKRLSDAVADGDNILALVRGSAVNHNGRSSSLIAPNGLSQQAVIRQALANGGIKPDRVDYIEVQGTGTSVGESIEVGALNAVYGQNRPLDRPLAIASVKTNIGHTEAASGVASLLKVVLALQNKQIPPHLHLKQPNTHINWDEIPFEVPTELMPWSKEEPRFAGISAFGFSGTNAHLILEEAPSLEPVQNSAERPLHLLALSAKTETALVQLAQKYQKYIAANPNLDLANICFSANSGRSHFQHRLSILADSTAELKDKLTAFNTDRKGKDIYRGEADGEPKIVFLFPDLDPKHWQMSRQLYDTQPTFKQSIDRCDDILNSYLNKSLIDILFEQSSEETIFCLDRAYLQPALFALEYSLCRLWQSWGIKPSAVMGYGIGEYVAACIAGVFSLKDGLKLAVGKENQEKDFEQIANQITYSQPQLNLISSVTSKSHTDITTAQYWCRPLEYSTNFAANLVTLKEYSILLPILPLAGNLVNSLPELPNLFASFNSPGDKWQQLLENLSQLYVQGTSVNWMGFDRDYSRRRIQLPTYAWQHKRHWFEPNKESSNGNHHGLNGNALSLGLDTEVIEKARLALAPFGDAGFLVQLKAEGEFSEAELKLLPKLLAKLGKQSPSSVESKPVDEPELRTADDIQAWLVERIAREIGVTPENIDRKEPFDNYGLDSVLAIEVASAGKQKLGIDMSPLLLVHYPTIESLSQHLAKQLEVSETETEVFEI
jgi:acyl transferase domain-containing protein/aryl carrier-like protein